MSVTGELVNAMSVGVPYGTTVRGWVISPDLETDLLASRHEFGASSTGFVPGKMLFGRPYSVDLPFGASPRFQILTEAITAIGGALQQLQRDGMKVELSDIPGLIWVNGSELTLDQVLDLAALTQVGNR